MRSLICAALTFSALLSSSLSLWADPAPLPSRFARCVEYRAPAADAVEAYWGLYQYPDAWLAQLYQESLCDPLAGSGAGAEGIAQFMPPTWREVARQLRLPDTATPYDLVAIDAGAFYMARQSGGWTSPRPPFERHRLAQASYNAGIGNIYTAQRRCGGALLWDEIKTCLPLVTGRHAQETITYVSRNDRWWREISGCAAFRAPRDLQAEWGC